MTSTTHFQLRKVVDNFVRDSPCLRTQPLVFSHRGHLGNERPAFAFTCTFYYQAYAHMISRDGWFFTVFRYDIPHVTYCKFNIGISNELATQSECTIVVHCSPAIITTLPPGAGGVDFQTLLWPVCYPGSMAQGRSKRSGWSGFGPTNICARGNHAQEINICYCVIVR